MINLKIALENAVVDDTDTELEYPFDEIETAALAAEDGFEFQVSRVVSAMESARPFSRRHRHVATEGISLEEHGAGFWALLAVAVAAAVGLIGKMLGWFEGGGSSGGGGGGGGGGSSTPIAKVEKKVEHVAKVVEQAGPEVIEETLVTPSPELRSVETSAEVKEVIEEQLSGMTEFQSYVGAKGTEFSKMMDGAMGHMELFQKNQTSVTEKIAQLHMAWEQIHAGEADGKFLSAEGQKNIADLVLAINGESGINAKLGSWNLRDFSDHYQNFMSNARNSHVKADKAKWREHQKNIAKIYADGASEMIASAKEMIEGMNQGLEFVSAAKTEMEKDLLPFIEKQTASDSVNWNDKSNAGKTEQLNSLIKSKTADEEYAAARKRAEDGTRAAFKSFLSWYTSYLRLSAAVVSVLNSLTEVVVAGSKSAHAVLRASAAALRREGKEVSEDLKKALDATKPVRG